MKEYTGSLTINFSNKPVDPATRRHISYNCHLIRSVFESAKAGEDVLSFPMDRANSPTITHDGKRVEVGLKHECCKVVFVFADGKQGELFFNAIHQSDSVLVEPLNNGTVTSTDDILEEDCPSSVVIGKVSWVGLFGQSLGRCVGLELDNEEAQRLVPQFFLSPSSTTNHSFWGARNFLGLDHTGLGNPEMSAYLNEINGFMPAGYRKIIDAAHELAYIERVICGPGVVDLWLQVSRQFTQILKRKIEAAGGVAVKELCGTNGRAPGFERWVYSVDFSKNSTPK